MRNQERFSLWFLTLLMLPIAPAFGNSGATPTAAGTPQLEIKQYRFSRHGADHDRLVLEFENKDSSHASPTLHTEKGSGKNWNVTVSNSVLLGAIPESLINDSFANKSRFLGSISVEMADQGFALQASLKGHGERIQTTWLSHPARLVIDAYGGTGTHGEHRETSSVSTKAKPFTIERSTKFLDLSHLMCFPATAKVGLTVIFHPTSSRYEEMQNVRINTDGLTPLEGTPGPDAIVCYPKKAQILASLSFEEKERLTEFKNTEDSHAESAHSASESHTNEHAPTAPAMPPISMPAASNKVSEADEDELDPGPVGHGHNHDARVPASAAGLMNPKSAAKAPEPHH